jgi:hypothetical protein
MFSHCYRNTKNLLLLLWAVSEEKYFYFFKKVLLPTERSPRLVRLYLYRYKEYYNEEFVKGKYMKINLKFV